MDNSEDLPICFNGKNFNFLGKIKNGQKLEGATALAQ